MDKKALTKLRNRIKKANASFSVGGSLCLAMEFQTMSDHDLTLLKQDLTAKKVPHDLLNKEIDRRFNLMAKNQ